MKKKLTILFALLCASMMSWAVSQDTYLGCDGGLEAYANSIKWYSLDDVTAPNEVVSIQRPGWAGLVEGGIYVNVGQDYDGVKFDGVAVTVADYCYIQGTGGILYISKFVNKCTSVEFTKDDAVVRGMRIQNDNGTGDACATGGGGSVTTPSYCDMEIGHEANPSADLNSFILLSVGSDGHGHTIVNIKQDAAKNTQMFDYINIVGIKDIGSDVTTGGAEEMAILFNTPAPDSDGNITFTLQWSTVNWGGRWQCVVTLPADATCASADPFPGDNTYCDYTDNSLKANNGNVTLTWETNGDGDVVITLKDGEGASNTHFRNEGFEYGGGKTMDDCWFVYSGTRHATCELASKYFTVEQAVNNGNTYALRKKDGETVPSGAVISFQGHAFSWKQTGAEGAYTLNKYFAYDYGYNCPSLEIPTDVAVTDAGVITFTGSALAESYTALVYLDGILKHRQAVTSGATLTYVPYITGTYQVKVTASAEGYPTTDPSDPADWNLTATPIVVGNSEYCEAALPHDHDKDANFSWETDNSGNMTITLLPLSGQTATFREQGMKLADFTVGSNRTAASEYFDRVYSAGGTTVVLNLKNSSIKPGQGEPIYFNGYVECLVDGTNTWPTANLTYTYGSKCTGQKRVTVSVNNADMGAATVDGVASKDVDAGTAVTCVATPAAGYEFVNWTKGGVEVSTSETYSPTIEAATDLVANFDYERTTYCFTPVLTNQGKKVYLTVGKGATEGTYQIKIYGSTELPITGIYNANTAMNYIKFNELDGNDIYLTVANGGWSYSNAGNGVVSSAEIRPRTGYTWRDIWNWGGTLELNEGTLHNINSILQQQHHFNWNNDCSDTEKPVMTSASKASNTASTVVLNVAATDDHVVDAFHVVDAANSIDETFSAAAQITLTGLTGGTTYHFAVTAIDAVGKESDTPAEVEVAMAAAASPVPTTAAPVPTWPANQVMSIYSNAYSFAPASLNSYNEGWYIPPTMAEENIEGDNYLRYHTNMTGLVGWQFGQISVATMEYIHVDIWPSEDGTITMGPTSADPTQIAGVTLNVVAGQWNSFDISIAELQAANASFDVTKVFQNQFTGYSAQTTFSVDNVYFYRTTPPPADEAAPTDVVASKVEESFASVKLSAQANDDSGVVHFKVMNGTNELVSDVEAVSGAAVTITVNGLTPNTNYTLSVVAFDEAGHEAEPVNVAVTTRPLPSAAPYPTHDAAAVLSVFSDAYEPAVAAGFRRTNWGSAPVAIENDYLLYTMSANVIVWGNNDGNAGHGNIDGLSGYTHDATPGLDVSGMTYVHFDVWCDAADQLNTVNINDVAVAVPTTRTIAGQWVSFDVDITGVALADRQNVRWMKFHPFTNCNAAIDNVYFWKAPKYTRDDDWMAPGELGTVCYPEGLVVTGATMYQMAGTDANGKFVFDEVDVLEPGVPYLFEAHSNALHFYATAETPATEAGTSSGMVGTFDEIVIPQASPNIYYFSGTKFYAVTARSTDLTVPANRAYVDLTTPHPAGAPRAGVRRVVFDVQGSNAATGFGEVQGDEQQSTKVLINGHLFIHRGEKTYDATGSLVK